METATTGFHCTLPAGYNLQFTSLQFRGATAQRREIVDAVVDYPHDGVIRYLSGSTKNELEI
jgi:hypothetical protein